MSDHAQRRLRRRKTGKTLNSPSALRSWHPESCFEEPLPLFVVLHPQDQRFANGNV